MKNGIPLLKPDAPKMKNRWPETGKPVSFTAHIVNQGNIVSGKARCIWKINGEKVKEHSLDSVDPGEHVTSSIDWDWEKGSHEISVSLDYPDSETMDLSSKNDSMTIRSDALPFCCYIHHQVRTVFHKSLNRVGSFSAIDWLQAHVERFNTALRESRYPSAPEGCLEQIYLDRVVYFHDKTELSQLRSRHDPAAQGVLVIMPNETIQSWMKNWDPMLPVNMAKQLGLVDPAGFYVDPSQNRVPGPDRKPLYWRFVPRPMIIGNTAGEFRFSEFSVLALNRQYGRPRGFAGDYFYDLADQYLLRLKDRLGYAVEHARVRIYQRNARGEIGREPVFIGYTGAKGNVGITNRPVPGVDTPLGFHLHPNPFGKIALSGENGVFLCEIRARGQTDYVWLDLTDFNLAWWRLQKTRDRDKPVVLEIDTIIPGGGAPSAPIRLRGGRTAPSRLGFEWLPSLQEGIRKYRLFAMKDRSSVHGNEFVLIKEIKASLRYIDQIPFSNVDTYFAITAVDPQGRDSPLSEWTYIPFCVKMKSLVLTPENQFFILDEGTGRILRMDDQGRFFRFYLHPLLEGGMRVTNLAWTPRNELVVSNAGSDRIEFYDVEGGFLYFIGESGIGPGQLKDPRDMAFNLKEDMAVADLGNKRIVLFDKEGGYIGRFGEGVVEEPQALAFSPNGELHVLDDSRKTCFVFREGVKHKFYYERSYGSFQSIGDIVFHPNGTAFISDPLQKAILVFSPEGNLLGIERPDPHGRFEVAGPAGLEINPNGGIIFVDRASSSIRILDLPKDLDAPEDD